MCVSVHRGLPHRVGGQWPPNRPSLGCPSCWDIGDYHLSATDRRVRVTAVAGRREESSARRSTSLMLGVSAAPLRALVQGAGAACPLAYTLGVRRAGVTLAASS